MRMSDDDWEAVIDTNLTGAFRVARRATRSMMRPRFGRMIFISSVVGQLGSAGQVNYAASKAGLVGLARSLARELGSRGVTAERRGPGLHRDRHDRGAVRRAVKKYAEQIPLGRMGTVDDIAATHRVPGQRRRRLHQRRADPGRRRPGDGSLRGFDRGGRRGCSEQHIRCSRTRARRKDSSGNPGGQEHPGGRRHPRHLDRVPRGPDRPGAGRDRHRLQLRPGDEPHRTGDQEARPGATAAGGRRHQRRAPGRVWPSRSASTSTGSTAWCTRWPSPTRRRRSAASSSSHPVRRRVDRGAGVGLLVQLPDHGRQAAADQPGLGRRPDLRRHHLLAGVRLDGRGQGRPGEHQPLPGPLSRARRASGSTSSPPGRSRRWPRRRSAAPTSSTPSGPRAPIGWDPKDQTPTAKAVVALLSDWFPATTVRSSTSTAACTRWAPESR